MVVAGVTPSMASARTLRHRAGTRTFMTVKREPPSCVTCIQPGRSSCTPGRSTTCTSSSTPSCPQPLSRFSVTTPRLVPRTGTALTTTRTAAR